MSQKDFEDLCRSIEGSISKVMGAVEKGLDKAGDAANNAINQAIENHQRQQTQQTRNPYSAPRSQQANRFATNTPIRVNNKIYRQQYASQSAASKALARSRFKSSASLTASGVALTSIGGVFTATFGVAEIVGVLTTAFSMDPDVFNGGIVGIAVGGVFFGLSVWALVSGVKRLSLGTRLKAFQRIFGDREVCSVTELSARTQLSPAKVVSTDKKLIAKGMLPQGRLDDDGTCIMVTRESYDLYLQAKHAYEQRVMEQRATQSAMHSAKQRAGATSFSSAASEKSARFLEQGTIYTQEISALNVAIDDIGLSEKIVQIVMTIEKILDRVKGDPYLLDKVSSLERLNDYYLPQTIKLLVAYEELEEQPVQGENIMNSRKEIESTLNTLCKAYENLLDLTFEDMTLDVSADISVLHAVLAQEGLTDNPFDAAAGSDSDKGEN